jgi:hypothetical protein
MYLIFPLQAMASSIRGANNLILEEIWQGASFAAKNGMYRYIIAHLFMHKNMYKFIYIHIYIYIFIHIYRKSSCTE